MYNNNKPPKGIYNYKEDLRYSPTPPAIGVLGMCGLMGGKYLQGFATWQSKYLQGFATWQNHIVCMINDCNPCYRKDSEVNEPLTFEVAS